MKPLYGRANKKMTLSDALTACLSVLSTKKTVALLYTPQHCKLALLENGVLRQSKGEVIDLKEVFEARVFNEDAELRWLNEQDGSGRAVLLSAREIPQPCRNQLPDDASLQALHTLPQTYLLWGEGVDQTKARAKNGLADGWSRLTTARIGWLDVPVPGIQEKERVHLKALEYLAEYDADGKLVQDGQTVEEDKRHGNVAVAAERLLCLIDERLLNLEVVQ